MVRLKITKLSPIHFDAEIHSGDQEIDEFFEKAFELAEENLSHIYVGSIESKVVSYYAISTGSFKGYVKNVKHQVSSWPSILLGRVGVDQAFQGKDIGTKMVEHAIMTAKKITKEIGCRFMHTETYDESIMNDFYIKTLNFIFLRKDYIKSKKQHRYTVIKDLMRD
jgi:GNAT superfamily N-acetyltransferase